MGFFFCVCLKLVKPLKKLKIDSESPQFPFLINLSTRLFIFSLALHGLLGAVYENGSQNPSKFANYI